MKLSLRQGLSLTAVGAVPPLGTVRVPEWAPAHAQDGVWAGRHWGESCGRTGEGRPGPAIALTEPQLKGLFRSDAKTLRKQLLSSKEPGDSTWESSDQSSPDRPGCDRQG